MSATLEVCIPAVHLDASAQDFLQRSYQTALQLLVQEQSATSRLVFRSGPHGCTVERFVKNVGLDTLLRFHGKRSARGMAYLRPLIMVKVARAVRWIVAFFALIAGVIVVVALTIVVSFRPLQRRAMQKEREVITAAAEEIIRGTGPAVDVLPLRTRLWARAASWHAQHCSYTNFSYDTGGITAHCATEELRFNFRSTCDDFWAGRLLKLTSCSATPFAMTIRRIVPGQQAVEVLSDGEPVVE